MLRGGRFEKSMDPDAAEYSASLDSDTRLFDSVIQINIAHAQMLKKQEILKKEDADTIIEALLELQETGTDALDLRPDLEDIHMVLEEYLKKEIGEETAGKLHTAKSRNDQVSASIRIFLREEILEIQKLTVNFVETMLELAKKNLETVMPGYTHLQVAEPTTFAHYLCSYCESFLRDVYRMNQSYKQVNQSPMGACALAGTSFPIDRKLVSDLLGFNKVLENTIDATGSRDFVLQIMSDIAILMTNMSRLCEEISIWSSAEFDMIEIPDEFSSTSSIMPQKKNPVIAELERAKTGRTIGNLIGGFNIIKSLTQAYNLDLQELTPLLWDSLDQIKPTLKVMTKHIEKIKPNPEKMLQHTETGFATMTELANTIVRETELPFRISHNIVGKLASQALKDGKSLADLTIDDLQTASKSINHQEVDISEEEFENALNPSKSVKMRNLIGGPSPKSVKEEISNIENKIEKQKSAIKKKTTNISKFKKNLQNISVR